MWRALLEFKEKFMDGEWIFCGDFNASKIVGKGRGHLWQFTGGTMPSRSS